MKYTKEIYPSRRFITYSLLSLLSPKLLLANKICYQTPYQPSGPFFNTNTKFNGNDMTNKGKAIGKKIQISGQVINKNCKPYNNAIIHIWQANAFGRYFHKYDKSKNELDNNFNGYTKIKTNKDGFYKFLTVYPGSYKISEKISRPSHIHLQITTTKGMQITTQVYFKDDPLNQNDILLNKTKNKDLLQISLKRNSEGILSSTFDIII